MDNDDILLIIFLMGVVFAICFAVAQIQITNRKFIEKGHVYKNSTSGWFKE